MRLYTLKDYPDNMAEVISSTLGEHYVLTGFYSAYNHGLQWLLQYTGDKDTLAFEIAMSEYILESNTVNVPPDYSVTNCLWDWQQAKKHSKK